MALGWRGTGGGRRGHRTASEKASVISRREPQKARDPPAAVTRLLGQASLGDQRQKSAKGDLVRGRRGASQSSQAAGPEPEIRV